MRFLPSRILVALILVVAIGVGLVLAQGIGRLEPSEPVETSYPIIYAGDSIMVPEDVESWTYFKPLFGGDRPSVNPAGPTVVNGRELIFEKPGEYYLLLNSFQPFRVVVLAPDEAVSDSVVRVFDFLTANLLVTQGHDNLYISDPDAYIKRMFLTKDPGLLLCGPTLALFQRLIYDRFRLPVRDVTYTGTTLSDGKVMYSTHNTLEIYLPDKRKWVQFDVNNGFLVEWLSALEISEIVRKTAGSGRELSPDEWAAIDWKRHQGVVPFRSVDAANDEAKFRPELVSKTSVAETWPKLSQFFVGGPSYRNGPRFGLPGLPKDYDLYYATQHDDPLLIEASKRWAGNWDLTVKVMTRAEMEKLLQAAYADQIQAKEWMTQIHPDQRKTLEAAGSP